MQAFKGVILGVTQFRISTLHSNTHTRKSVILTLYMSGVIHLTWGTQTVKHCASSSLVLQSGLI